MFATHRTTRWLVLAASFVACSSRPRQQLINNHVTGEQRESAAARLTTCALQQAFSDVMSQPSTLDGKRVYPTESVQSLLRARLGEPTRVSEGVAFWVAMNNHRECWRLGAESGDQARATMERGVADSACPDAVIPDEPPLPPRYWDIVDCAP